MKLTIELTDEQIAAIADAVRNAPQKLLAPNYRYFRYKGIELHIQTAYPNSYVGNVGRDPITGRRWVARVSLNRVLQQPDAVEEFFPFRKP